MFSALWPSATAIEHLRSAVDPSGRYWQRVTAGLRGFRFIPVDRWHLTLCFYGDDADPDELAERLDANLAALGPLTGDGHDADEAGALRLRFDGAGTFRGVLWVGVREADGDTTALTRLARAVGADGDDFRPHVTVARWRGGPPRTSELTSPLHGYTGVPWRASSVDLVASEQGGDGPRYRTLARFPLR